MNLNSRKILVVDDVRFTRLTLVKMVRDLGEPTVLEADDGATALALLRQDDAAADCIVTDLDMPRLDGVGLLRAVREGASNVARNTKVVLLTGHSEFERIGPALVLEVDAFLAKPVSRPALTACFERLFAPQNGSAAKPDPRAPALQPRPAASDRALNGERMVALQEAPHDAELARDLLFNNGRLLMVAGTRLNANTQALLSDLLPMAGLPAQVWIRTANNASS